jgi:hypothetical protein
MERRYAVLVLMGVLLVYLTGCGGGGKRDGMTNIDMPDWCLQIPESDEALYSCGTATSKDLQMSIEKAKQAGRADIARQMETKIKALFKRFQEETGLGEDAEFLSMATDVSKSVTSTSLIGCKAKSQEIMKEGPIFRAYVLMELPTGPANQALLNKINEEKNLYTRFRVTKAYDELDKEVDEYEDWKKNQ